jgi:hypothetical protein
MFEKLAQELKSLADSRKPVDPSRFGDPLAGQTGWTPARDDAAFGDKLVKVSSSRWEFRASARAKLSALVFVLIGLAVLIGVPVYKHLSGSLSLNKNTVMPLLIGLVFSLAGGFLLYAGTTPVVFDKRKGYFWKGRKAPDEVLDRKTLKHYAMLADIHALQLLSELCSGPKTGSYYRYELNLVLKDGKRINVVVRGDKNKLRDEASALSTFLGKPVWDAA